jgi:hypothetical protein
MFQFFKRHPLALIIAIMLSAGVTFGTWTYWQHKATESSAESARAILNQELTAEQIAYIDEINNSTQQAYAGALTLGSDGELTVIYDPVDLGDCNAGYCGIFEKQDNGYKVTLPLGWSTTGEKNFEGDFNITELTYWDPWTKRVETVIAKDGETVTVPESLYDISFSELGYNQLMYVSPTNIRWSDTYGAVLNSRIDVRFSYSISEYNLVPIILTEAGLMACLDGSQYTHDEEMAEEGHLIESVC